MFLSGNRLAYIPEYLHVNKLPRLVPRRKAGHSPLPMLGDAPLDIVRHPDVEHPRRASHDVNVVCFQGTLPRDVILITLSFEGSAAKNLSLLRLCPQSCLACVTRRTEETGGWRGFETVPNFVVADYSKFPLLISLRMNVSRDRVTRRSAVRPIVLVVILSAAKNLSSSRRDPLANFLIFDLLVVRCGCKIQRMPHVDKGLGKLIDQLPPRWI
jgi:hypothetical protein